MISCKIVIVWHVQCILNVYVKADMAEMLDKY